jgi:hypothetical protein
MNALDSIATVGANTTWNIASFGNVLSDSTRNRKRLGCCVVVNTRPLERYILPTRKVGRLSGRR